MAHNNTLLMMRFLGMKSDYDPNNISHRYPYKPKEPTSSTTTKLIKNVSSALGFLTREELSNKIEENNRKINDLNIKIQEDYNKILKSKILNDWKDDVFKDDDVLNNVKKFHGIEKIIADNNKLIDKLKGGAKVPKAKVPKAKVSKAKVSKAKVSKAKVPKAKVPKAKVPKAKRTRKIGV